MLKTMQISEIRIAERFRPLNRVRAVEELAPSIAESGLINPVSVNEAGELVAGLHRLEACKSLGMDEIPVIVLPVTGREARLAEIDENLFRVDLTILEKGEFILARKEFFPHSKHGGDRRSEAAKSSCQNGDLKSFAKDTARKMDVSETTIHRYERLARNIEPEVRDIIRPTRMANSFQDLYLLSRLSPVQQKKVCQEWLGGDHDSVAEVLEKLAKSEKPSCRKQPGGKKVAQRPEPKPEARVQRMVETVPPQDSKAGKEIKDHEASDLEALVRPLPAWVASLLEAAKGDWQYILLARKGGNPDGHLDLTMGTRCKGQFQNNAIEFVCQAADDEVVCFLSEEVIRG